MPNGSLLDRRPRYPIQLPLLHTPTASESTQCGVGWTWNLGEGGACVELAEAFPSRMPLWLRLHTDYGALTLETRVAWVADASRTRSPGGGVLHGVGFKRPAPDTRQALRDLILAQCRERRIGVRLPVDFAVGCEPQRAIGPPLCGRIGNLSRGGLSLHLRQALPPGVVLGVTLSLPSGSITTAGEIVWADPGYRQTFGDPIRHGVQFLCAGSLGLVRVLAELTAVRGTGTIGPWHSDSVRGGSNGTSACNLASSSEKLHISTIDKLWDRSPFLSGLDGDRRSGAWPPRTAPPPQDRKDSAAPRNDPSSRSPGGTPWRFRP